MGQTAYSSYEVILEDGFVDAANGTTAYNTTELKVEEPSGATENTAFVRFAISEPSAFTTAIPDNAILRGLELRLYRKTATGSGTLSVRAANGTVGWVEGAATWLTFDGVGTWYPDELVGAGEARSFSRRLDDVDTTTINTAYTLDLGKGIALEGYEFGSDINIMLFGVSTTNLTFYSLSGTTAYIPKYRVLYEIPTPDGPSITVTPQDNGIDGYINITKHSENHTNYSAVYKTGSTTATFGDHTGSPLPIPDSAQTQIDTTSFATGNGAPLSAEDTNEAFSVYAEDSINDDAAGGQGNTVFVARPNITSSTGYTGHTDSSDPAGSGGTALTSAQADIGDEVAIVVVGDTGSPPSGGSQGFFKHVYVNWDSGASDADSDYTKYTLDEPATTTLGNIALTHRYSTALVKTIKVQIEDAKGWRSDKTALTTQQPIPPEANPVAALTTSRTKILEATYGEKNAALVLSGQQSHPVGSNRKIDNYLFSYEAELATTIATLNAYTNDNSVFDSGSKRVAMVSLGKDSMNTAQFKIFGLASFMNDGTSPTPDTAGDFSHYRQAVDTITCGPALRTLSDTETILTEYIDTSDPNYFKTVDCVMCIAVDTDDDGDRYALRVYSTDDVVTANSVFRTPINTEVRWKANDVALSNTSQKYSWGGFTQISAGNIDFLPAAGATVNITTSGLDIVSGVATVACAATHSLQVGDYVFMDVSDDPTYDEYVTVDDLVSATSFKYKTDKADKNDMEGAVKMHAIELDTLSNGGYDWPVTANPDWFGVGFYVGDIVKMEGSQSATVAAPKFYKIAGISSTNTGGQFFDRMTIETNPAKLSTAEKGYITTALTNDDNQDDVSIARHNVTPSRTVALYNTAGNDDTITFHHKVIDNGGSSFVENSDETTQKVRLAQPATLDLDTLVTDGSIAIESATMSRRGGIGAAMSLGDARYPASVVRTQIGIPKIVVKIHVLTQAGLRDIFSLVEGDRFDYVFIDSRKVDTPTTAYRQYRMKLEAGSLAQDGSSANRYVANCTFFVVGEDVS